MCACVNGKDFSAPTPYKNDACILIPHFEFSGFLFVCIITTTISDVLLGIDIFTVIVGFSRLQASPLLEVEGHVAAADAGSKVLVVLVSKTRAASPPV